MYLLLIVDKRVDEQAKTLQNEPPRPATAQNSPPRKEGSGAGNYYVDRDELPTTVCSIQSINIKWEHDSDAHSKELQHRREMEERVSRLKGQTVQLLENQRHYTTSNNVYYHKKCDLHLPQCITVSNLKPLIVQKDFKCKSSCSTESTLSKAISKSQSPPSPTDYYTFQPVGECSIINDSMQGDLLRKRQDLYDHFNDSPKPNLLELPKPAPTLQQLSGVSSIDDSIITSICLEAPEKMGLIHKLKIILNIPIHSTSCFWMVTNANIARRNV